MGSVRALVNMIESVMATDEVQSYFRLRKEGKALLHVGLLCTHEMVNEDSFETYLLFIGVRPFSKWHIPQGRSVFAHQVHGFLS